MTRIAILADIHGNVPALEAVIADLETVEVDEVLVGGDLVGRGPQGSQVVARIRDLGWPAIAGNHEDYLLGFRRGEIPSEWRRAEEWAAARWMAAELEEEDIRYLENLPFALQRPGLRLVHGTPSTNREGIGPWTGDDELAGHLEPLAENVLVCAHIHRPMIRHLGASLVVNVGAVGLPFNRDPRAQYAIFESQPEGGWTVELRQVDYDRRLIFDIYDSTGFLVEGGTTARLLKLELEHAAPVLVPFQGWAEARGVVASDETVDQFLEQLLPSLES